MIESAPQKRDFQHTPLRVGLLGIYHETNTFIQSATTLADFREGYWLESGRIRDEYQGANHEISGLIEVIDGAPDMELVPIFYAMATPGGLITRDCYEQLLDRMMQLLDEAGALDACLVAPHGAGVAEGYPDMDGHWLSLLRRKLGSEVPVIGTLDPHANVSDAMVDATNGLIAYATNPHIDQKRTGMAAARLLVRTLRGEISPVQFLVKPPVAISIEQQFTSNQPCLGLYTLAQELEQRFGLAAVSVLLGFPYADVEEMGSGFIMIADRNHSPAAAGQAQEAASQLSDFLLDNKQAFNGKKSGIGEVLRDFEDHPQPVLLLDMGDNIGGGAPGNSTLILEHLEASGFSDFFICLHDPESVAQCAEAKVGAGASLSLGGKRGFQTSVDILALYEGHFTEDAPRHGGFVHYDMGPTAVVRTLSGNTVMLTTRRTPPYSLRQLTAFGLDPHSFRGIVAKGVNAPIAAYCEVCPSIIQVDTAGVTQADMTLFEYKNRKVPLFPFEEYV
ncbi:microcystin degradation protein MlrC [Dyadobacter sp. BE34]|uniref:Microcystin degradation protein MlrC n=1 Tax=Dyadobacter fermentans TaxID=94254 RepID=A0ABU1QU50_9BACT|nr:MULTISPECIES: M81 family metallopeptidase [Dyadobacter]MDR6804678.1 microcystin degradation protein MlrC [Dyadobacter fermentans]MDR7043563.1 microcystin degradation protein MlrC [Dyadobacter sp. BE242]MDR7197875.1 microcystin degradation protein MlrC [Dyadobacter sp. BE34]MDR7214692.1 microcystin degradation protein MlrC [Dyadobacter sp. BE31]MDR7262227.1 microcystin degradation protein MlrC [Dyadobacter sp. BE32]